MTSIVPWLGRPNINISQTLPAGKDVYFLNVYQEMYSNRGGIKRRRYSVEEGTDRCEGFGELHICYVGGLCAFFIKRGLNRTQVFPTQRSFFVDRSILQRIGQWPDSDASSALLRGGGQSPSFTDTKYSSFVKAPGRRPIPDLFVSVIVDWYAKDYKNWP